MEIKTLTHEEIQTLQVDAALRLIGEYTTQLVSLSNEIGQAIMELGKAKYKLDGLKNDKQTLVEMMRSLKVIVTNS